MPQTVSATTLHWAAMTMMLLLVLANMVTISVSIPELYPFHIIQIPSVSQHTPQAEYILKVELNR